MDLVQIAMRLTGARTAAAEARGVSTAIAGTGTAAEAAGVSAAASSTRTDRMRRAWSTAGRIARTAALGAAGGAAILAFQTKAAVEQSTELAAVTAGLHRNLGLTNQEGSRWATVARARGIDAKSLNLSFTTLSRNIAAAATDNAAYEDSFAKLGLTQDEVKNGTRDFSGFVTRLADAFGDAEGGAERQALAQKLLGRGYQSVLPLFADGSKSLQEQLEWADKYHVTMGGQMVKDNMDLVKAQRESKVAWLGIQQTLSAAVLPILTDAHGEFQDLAQVVSDPKLTDGEKISILGKKLQKAADKGFNAFTKMLPELASRIGEKIPKVAGAFVNGFLNANAWGKLLLGGWLIKKFGGAAIANGIGTKIGGWIAAKMLAKMGATLGANTATTSLSTAMAPMMMGLGAAVAPWLGAALLAALAIYMITHKQEMIDMVKSATNLHTMTPEEIAENKDELQGTTSPEAGVGPHGAPGASAPGATPRPRPTRRLGRFAPGSAPGAAPEAAAGTPQGGSTSRRPVVFQAVLPNGKVLAQAVLTAAEVEAALA